MNLWVFAYGIFILIGGVVGHLKAKSLASLVMGLVFGAGLIGSAFRKRGVLSLILTLFLDAFFTWRWVSTGKFMPPGVLSLVSSAVLILLAIQYQRLKNQVSS
jgi:uncharacterized membrane protein (UPF0136 family)